MRGQNVTVRYRVVDSSGAQVEEFDRVSDATGHIRAHGGDGWRVVTAVTE